MRMQFKRFLLAVPFLLLASAPAQACQLICVKTAATYDGNLGGLAGADAKCAAEYPGFKFPRSATLVDAFGRLLGSYNGNPQWGYGGANTYVGSVYYLGWTGTTTNGDSNASFSTYNCSNWTNNSSGSGGAMYYYNSNMTYMASLACTYRLPLVCCNM